MDPEKPANFNRQRGMPRSSLSGGLPGKTWAWPAAMRGRGVLICDSRQSTRPGFKQQGLLPQRWIVGEQLSDSAL